MTSLVFVFFVAFLSLCSAANNIEAQIYEVFGKPIAAQDSPPATGQTFIQAAPVRPLQVNVTVTETAAESDYYGVDDFNLPEIDYDTFDWTLTKRVSATSQGNFLLSPLGLKLALAILTEAATGVTKSELLSVLGFNLDPAVVRQKFTSIINSLKKESPEYDLKLGSRIYVDSVVKPMQMFAAIAESFYKTQIKHVDFHNPPEAAKQINAWVSNITKGKIARLVNEDDIAEVAVMVLNTLYFKGSWRHQFTPNATKLDQFYVLPTSLKNVSYMNVNDKFFYAESNRFDAKILRMPYLGNKYAMYILVPNSLSGLSRVIDNLSFLRSELSNLREHYVDVTFPKFNLDYTCHLGGILRELGVRQAFEDTASFPGLARGQYLQDIVHLKISKVLQRAGIEVNELGSVAYAVTEISLVNKFGEDTASQVEVVANRPFLFFIQDEDTNQLLMTGRISDPSQLDGSLKLV